MAEVTSLNLVTARDMESSHRQQMDALDREFGYRPDEHRGERWTVYNHHLIVIHPEQRPRIFKPGCCGVYYELEPTFP